MIVAQSSKGARLARIACWPKVLNNLSHSPALSRITDTHFCALFIVCLLPLLLQHALACHVAQMLRTSALSAQ